MLAAWLIIILISMIFKCLFPFTWHVFLSLMWWIINVAFALWSWDVTWFYLLELVRVQKSTYCPYLADSCTIFRPLKYFYMIAWFLFMLAFLNNNLVWSEGASRLNLSLIVYCQLICHLCQMTSVDVESCNSKDSDCMTKSNLYNLLSFFLKKILASHKFYFQFF